jgi:DNA-binding MarR family transcriptional regulator
MSETLKVVRRPKPAKKKAEHIDSCPDDDFDDHVEWAVKAWPVIDPDVEAIVCRVEKAQRYLERAAVDTLDDLDLPQGELKILLRLARGTRSQGEIAKSLLVSTGTMTNQLDKLEAAGRIVRLPDPGDRRGKLVELTAKGRATLDTYINVQAEYERQLLGQLSPGDKKQLNHLLRKLLASLGEKPAPARS